jgi:hypothetical protein
MLKRLFLLCLTLAVALAAPGCSKKQTAAEMQAEKERVWRERQRVRSAEYYNEIVQKYPDSEYAAQAKERLDALGGPPPPKPGSATAKK